MCDRTPASDFGFSKKKSSRIVMYQLVDVHTVSHGSDAIHSTVLLFALDVTTSERICVCVQDAAHLVYVRIPDAESSVPKADRIERMRLFPLSGTTLDKHSVLKLYFKNKEKATRAYYSYQKRGHDVYFDENMDVKYHLLLEIGLHPHALFELETTTVSQTRLTLAQREVSCTVDDIRCMTSGAPPDADNFLMRASRCFMHFLFDANSIGNERQPVVCLLSFFFNAASQNSSNNNMLFLTIPGWPDNQVVFEGWHGVFFFESSVAMVEAVNREIREKDPLFVFGHDLRYNGFNKVMAYMRQSTQVFLPSWSLLIDSAEQQNPSHVYTTHIGHVFCMPMPGRLVIDTWLFLHAFDKSGGMRRFSFESMLLLHANYQIPDTLLVDMALVQSANGQGLRNKVATVKESILHLSRLPTVFWQIVDEKLMVLDTLYFFSQQTFLPLHEVQSAPVSSVWKMTLLYRMTQQGCYYPLMDKYEDGMVGDKLQGASHSTVTDDDHHDDDADTSVSAKPGRYRIGEFDFKSNHPAIIIAHNLSPETMCRSRAHGDNPQQHYEQIVCDNNGVIYGHHVLRNNVRQGLIPTELMRLIQLRDACKRVQTPVSQSRAQALKLISNSLWGLIAAHNSFLFQDQAISQIITWKSRQLFKHAVSVARSLSLNVVYGYSDSIFISTNNTPSQETHTWCQMVCQKINEDLKWPMRIEFVGFYDLILISLSNMFLRGDKGVLVKGTGASRKNFPNSVRNSIIKLASLAFDSISKDELEKQAQVVLNMFTERKFAMTDMVMTKHYSLSTGLSGDMAKFFCSLWNLHPHIDLYGEIEYVDVTNQGPTYFDRQKNTVHLRDLNMLYYSGLAKKDIDNIINAIFGVD
jgi:DNA polymerase elongation subunit (family B)